MQLIGEGQKLKPRFISINQVGVASGATGDGLQMQTVNGINYKTLSAGLGVGLDYYCERTIPIFIDVRKNIFSKENTPFIYADFGTNVPWVKENKEQTWYTSDYDKGKYYDVGLGYKLLLNKKISVNMSVGYSQKQLQETRTTHFINDFPPYTRSSNPETYDYALRRFSFKVGLIF